MNSDPTSAVVFFDGPCVLCQRSVQWMAGHLRSDVSEHALKFASLQGDMAQRLLPEHLRTAPPSGGGGLAGRGCSRGGGRPARFGAVPDVPLVGVVPRRAGMGLRMGGAEPHGVVWHTGNVHVVARSSSPACGARPGVDSPHATTCSSWDVPCLGWPAQNPKPNRRKPGCPSPWWPQGCPQIRPCAWREAPRRGVRGSHAGCP